MSTPAGFRRNAHRRLEFLVLQLQEVSSARQLPSASLNRAAGQRPSPERQDGDRPRLGPVVISTWDFGKAANEVALLTLSKGGTAMDAVESAIKTVELSTIGGAGGSVGRTGLPNAAGVVQLDACVMNGPGHQAGAVAAVEGVVHPISVARLVMERSPHVMLVGEGARWFAEQQGLEVVPCEKSDKAAHDAWRAAQTVRTGPARMPADGGTGGFGGPDNHDTVALLVLTDAVDIAGGCSTSGWGGKLPGRVGDSPIIGAGLYVDNAVGAAGATGLGEHVMVRVVSYQIVENMRTGMTPQAACQAAVERCVAAMGPDGEQLSMNFVALDKQGRFGAAGTGNFPYAVATAVGSEVQEVAGFYSRPQPSGGNVRR